MEQKETEQPSKLPDLPPDKAYDGLRMLMFESWQNAVNHGWRNLDRTLAEEIALMHSELSEALEHYRENTPEQEIIFTGDHKPDGIAVEFADVLIRIFDTCEARGIPLALALKLKFEYNRNRPFLHGGKKI